MQYILKRFQDKPSTRRGKVGILKPQGSLERARETRDQQESSDNSEILSKLIGESEDSKEKGNKEISFQLKKERMKVPVD